MRKKDWELKHLSTKKKESTERLKVVANEMRGVEKSKSVHEMLTEESRTAY